MTTTDGNEPPRIPTSTETRDQPLTLQEREVIDRFLTSRQAHRQLTIEVEQRLKEPLEHYHHQHLFYRDVSDLTHFRLNFFRNIGCFLQKSVATTYQLEFWDRESHRKYCFPTDKLLQADACVIKVGTAVETLTYGHLGYKLRRTFDIQNHRLYWEKSQFYVNGKPYPITDGLMLLQQRLEVRSMWLRDAWLRINDFT
ncbi:hypothetical protein ACUIJQ_04555 [Levilactobacillus hammesii]|uniref:Uncharacterized protein n=1 Tax=Levilactobacillus hammesii DSM 16381 TaxID=1423753 RepID=A0A0R1V6F9_9LACO|nr:hypothetical protein [Levilactobacillus hammesii]KRL98549.1 hypothetical protein FD28_GL001913 [Levilactobacillus hammesii DSM 16381]